MNAVQQRGARAKPFGVLSKMKLKLKEEQIHLLFKIGVVIKGIDGALEAIAGFALFFTTTAALRNLVDWLTAGELAGRPDGFCRQPSR